MKKRVDKCKKKRVDKCKKKEKKIIGRNKCNRWFKEYDKRYTETDSTRRIRFYRNYQNNRIRKQGADGPHLYLYNAIQGNGMTNVYDDEYMGEEFCKLTLTSVDDIKD